jgi:hypothetical protein
MYELDTYLRVSRSVHNTRIERLWYDVTHGFGEKWKKFFQDLEVNMSLDVANPSHIWLLHHLFLDAINKDAAEWTETWNSHVLEIRGERHQSPRSMFFFSMIRDGPRGLVHTQEPIHENIADPSMYGIDWDVVEDHNMMEHFLDHNPRDWTANNAFSNVPPAQLSNVRVDSPDCPFTDHELDILEAAVAAQTDRLSRMMEQRKHTWMVALHYCKGLYDSRESN